MKQAIIIAVLIFTFAGSVNSQSLNIDEYRIKNLETQSNKLQKPVQLSQTPLNSNELFVGLSIPAGRLSTQLTPGFSVGYNYVFNFTPGVDFYLNLTGNLFTTKKSDSASTVEKFVDIALLFETTIGPRFTFEVAKGSPVKMFGEAGIGFYIPVGTQYIFDDSENFSGIESLSDAFRGGINVGVGAQFTGARTIITKIKYHRLFSIPTSYFGLYAGITL